MPRNSCIRPETVRLINHLSAEAMIHSERIDILHEIWKTTKRCHVSRWTITASCSTEIAAKVHAKYPLISERAFLIQFSWSARCYGCVSPGWPDDCGSVQANGNGRNDYSRKYYQSTHLAHGCCWRQVVATSANKSHSRSNLQRISIGAAKHCGTLCWPWWHWSNICESNADTLPWCPRWSMKLVRGYDIFVVINFGL